MHIRITGKITKDKRNRRLTGSDHQGRLPGRGPQDEDRAEMNALFNLTRPDQDT